MVLSSFCHLFGPHNLKLSFCLHRQWSKSEENGSLALWFPKKDLEKQVNLNTNQDSTPPSLPLKHSVADQEISGVFFSFSSSEYRALDLPMFKHYVGCATGIFLCIFFVQMFVTKE